MLPAEKPSSSRATASRSQSCGHAPAEALRRPTSSPGVVIFRGLIDALRKDLDAVSDAEL